MDDLISRQAAIEAASRGCKEWRGIFSDVAHELEQIPTIQLTLYGYNIEHLALIASVMAKENMTPEEAVQAFAGIVRVVQMIADEQKEIIKKAVEEWT